jgi:hypothetical protein
MIAEGHLDEDDDPTIGLKSGKAKASRESGGFLPWTEEDMATASCCCRGLRFRLPL